ncbi:MAG TPA: hypothetical protein PLP33_24750 [Leptospiraceae bacterium]|nr:hypothetical protein [Leptospiraceae bacterium]
MIYTAEHAKELQEKLQAAHVRVTLSTLGGVERASLMILICLDEKSTWKNEIMENSRYARFTAGSLENKLELFSGGHKLAKFRKCHTPNIDKMAEKLQKWVTDSLLIEKS